MKPTRPPSITYLLNGETWDPTSNVVPIEFARSIGWVGVIVSCGACMHRDEACLLLGKTRPDLMKRRSSGLVCLKCKKKRARVIESLPTTHRFEQRG
jgi:hypothetical protein